jgi:hypothetical protein
MFFEFRKTEVSGKTALFEHTALMRGLNNAENACAD